MMSFSLSCYLTNKIKFSYSWCYSSAAQAVLFACLFFFFQAEDGIRDYKVTGVQTCALPISGVELRQIIAAYDDVGVRRPVGVTRGRSGTPVDRAVELLEDDAAERTVQIGRASCRERV